MSKTQLTRHDFYPLADHYTGDKRFRLSMYGGSIPQRWLKARWNGEYRAPRRGEWYLSGNPIDAYKAPNNLTTPFHIAQIVYVQEEVIATVIEVLEG